MTLPAIGEPELFLTAQLVATLFMAGLIWFVQIVHYPLMGNVGAMSTSDPGAASAYASRHATLTTRVVALPMLVEVAAATVLVLEVPPGSTFSTAALGFGLAFLLWVVTATCSIPCHSRLQRSFDSRAHRRLVLTNWIRTLAWSLRVPIAIAMYHAYLETPHA